MAPFVFDAPGDILLRMLKSCDLHQHVEITSPWHCPNVITGFPEHCDAKTATYGSFPFPGAGHQSKLACFPIVSD